MPPSGPNRRLKNRLSWVDSGCSRSGCTTTPARADAATEKIPSADRDLSHFPCSRNREPDQKATLALDLLDRPAKERRTVRLSGYLKVLLADCEGERAALLEERLREISDAVIVRVPAAGSLIDAVTAEAPDVIIVDMARPDRDALDDLRRIGADNPRPVVVFVDRDDRAFMEEAIAAGVSSYNVVSAAFPDVKPIVMAAVAIFRKYQQVAVDLQQARASLIERETIDRAKALLMKERNFAEPQAYRWLRRKAMNESKRIVAIAAELLGSGQPEGPQE